MSKIKKILLRTHLITLIILLINFIINVVFEIGLISNLRLVLKILFYASACILFFYNVKPFKKRALYFSVYIFSPFFIFIGWLIDGIFGAILGSVFLFFFVPNDTRFENDQIQINTKFQGFLGSCCKYEVIEKKYFLFERKIGEFQSEEDLYFKKEGVKIQENILQMHLVLKDYDQEKDRYFAKDTIIYAVLKH
ncbi:hypothetical protein C8C83_2327 [Flavobacterium sp. 90]|uniref:hypothetical protein n=1 Tax=unclassified Flavobacterium TaxID=196869 RepID=UPI000EACCFE3|nr:MULTISPECIES: hypothetical protein [unclassified Flavobacterium]RKR10649.1 hypothetical protein C8C82_2632 [Flavobacterium sp. 81]TCK54432.1 hypothetical protein C8C83_2327 [Flavobacterium sp. 90]